MLAACGGGSASPRFSRAAMSTCLSRHGAHAAGAQAPAAPAVIRRVRKITADTLGVVFADRQSVWIAVAPSQAGASRVAGELENVKVRVAKQLGNPQADQISIAQDGLALIWERGDLSLANSRTLSTCLESATAR